MLSCSCCSTSIGCSSRALPYPGSKVVCLCSALPIEGDWEHGSAVGVVELGCRCTPEQGEVKPRSSFKSALSLCLAAGGSCMQSWLLCLGWGGGGCSGRCRQQYLGMVSPFNPWRSSGDRPKCLPPFGLKDKEYIYIGLGQLSHYGVCILLPDWVRLYLQGNQGSFC